MSDDGPAQPETTPYILATSEFFRSGPAPARHVILREARLRPPGGIVHRQSAQYHRTRLTRTRLTASRSVPSAPTSRVLSLELRRARADAAGQPCFLPDSEHWPADGLIDPSI